jgi:hypothetical protein
MAVFPFAPFCFRFSFATMSAWTIVIRKTKSMEIQVKRGPNYVSNMRRSRSLLQKQLAVLLGLRTDRCVSHYENGTAFPPFLTAVMLEIVLGARLSELYPDLYRECRELVIARAQQFDSAAHRAIISRLRQEDPPNAHPRTG